MKHHRLSHFFATFSVIGLGLALSQEKALGQVFNPSFELSQGNNFFNGWTTKISGNTDSGDLAVVTSTFGIAPPNGTHQALLTTTQSGGAISASSLTTFSGLTSGALNIGGNAVEGSAIKQTFSITQADVGKYLSFNFDFLTEVPQPNNIDVRSFAYVAINGTLMKLADVDSPLLHASPSTTWSYETGYQTFNYQLNSTGPFAVAVGIVDVDGLGGTFASVESALLVDNFQITPVPEPWQWSWLTACGLGALAFARRFRVR